MIEENPKYKLHQRVLVKELGTFGTIYERGIADSGDRVYGVRLDRTVWPRSGQCTEVWHCEAEGLEAALVQNPA